jgi:hypothetical protein
MSNTPELVDHYRLHPLNPQKKHSDQPLVFKSWRSVAGDTVAPPRWDLSKPVAVESKRFPNQYLNLVWSGNWRHRETDPYKKNVADFAALLNADRHATGNNVARMHNIA